MLAVCINIIVVIIRSSCSSSSSWQRKIMVRDICNVPVRPQLGRDINILREQVTCLDKDIEVGIYTMLRLEVREWRQRISLSSELKGRCAVPIALFKINQIKSNQIYLQAQNTKHIGKTQEKQNSQLNVLTTGVIDTCNMPSKSDSIWSI